MEELAQNALAFLKNGNLEKAANLYLKLAVEYPTNENYLISAANCYDRIDDKTVALKLYNKALGINPHNLTALLNASTICYELKKYKQSVEFANRALSVQENNFVALMNLGNISYADGDYASALQLYEKLYTLNPNSYNAILSIANTCYNIGQYKQSLKFALMASDKRPTAAEPYIVAGNTYIEMGQNEKAAECLKKAAAITPNSDWLCLSLSTMYQKIGDWRQCLHYQWKTIALRGGYMSVEDHINYGYILYEAYEDNAAELVAKYLERWQSCYPDNPIVSYIASALKNEQNVVSSDLTYVKTLFDGFAPSFDEIVAALDYNAPEYIASMLKDTLKTKLFKKRRILDLGCGTGLCAAAVQKYFPNEDYYGVDISEKMLAEAEKKNLYKELYADDMLNFLSETEELFHAVIAGDVLTYMGELKQLFRRLSKVIKFGGLLCFTITKNIFDDNDYHLAPSGRFTHSLTYIHRLLQYSGFEVVRLEERVLRHEGGKDVMGYVVMARKAIEIVFE